MKVVGKNIIVSRGESFSLTRKVYKNDLTTPFVLAKSIRNPYLIITVASSPFKSGGYKCNWWIDLSTYPSFTSLTPVIVDDDVISSNTLPSGYSYNSCIFYTQDENSNKTFYYYNNETSQYEEYSFIFRKTFSYMETKEWVEGLYTYQFKVVGGTRTKEVLQGMFKGLYPDKRLPEDNRTLYCKIKEQRPDLVKNIRYSAPLATFFVEDVLQRPEKLTVKT